MFTEIDPEKNKQRHLDDPASLVTDIEKLQESILANIGRLSVDIDANDSELASSMSRIYGDVKVEEISLEMVIDAYRLLRKLGYARGINLT